MEWGPRQPGPTLPPVKEKPEPPRFHWFKTGVLGLIVLLVFPFWFYQIFTGWYNQRPIESDTPRYLLTYTHSEILLAEAAERHDLGQSMRWMLATSTPETAVSHSISLLEKFHSEHPSSAAHAGIDQKLASLYLRQGNTEKAQELGKQLASPYKEIILTLAAQKPLSLEQLSILEKHHDEHPQFSEAAFWHSLHLKYQDPELLSASTTVEYFEETTSADQKLLYRAMSIGFCYTCLALGIAYFLFNFRKLDHYSTSQFTPTLVIGLFLFLLLEYLSSYSQYFTEILCLEVLQLSERLSFIISDAVYRYLPATLALIFFHYSKQKDQASTLGSFKKTLPACCIFWGCGIFLYFLIHRILAPHRIGDYITGLEGLFNNPAEQSVFIYSLISLVFIAPFAEEIIFRGLLLSSLQSKLGNLVAIFTSSLIFALVHVQGFTDTLHIFILGLLLAAIYLKTRSLWPGIIAHAGFNAWLLFDTWNVYLAN